MADEIKKTAIIDLQFDTADIVKRIAEVKKEQEALKSSTKELSKDFEKNAEAITINGLKLKALGKEEQALNKVVADNQKMVTSQTGSIDQQRAQLALLTTQYNALSEEERENTDAGKALTKQVKSLSDSLKGQEKAVGDTRRNVGNYKDEIKDAFKEMNLFSGVTDKATHLQEGFAKAQNIAKAAMGGNINMLKLFKLALASTGIGLVVLALGALVTFLTQSQKGLDFVNTKLAGLKTVIGFVVKEISAFGETIFNAFDNPKQAIKDLAEAIQTNLINRVKAFAVIWDALRNGDMKKLNDGLIQATTGVTDATDKTVAYAKELNNIRLIGEEIEKENIRIANEERKLNVERAQSKSLVEQLKFISQDTTKAIGERISATQKAFDIEQKSINGLIKLQKERIANIEREQKLSNNLNADNEKLAEERIKLAEMVEGSTTRQIELNGLLNSLNAEAARIAKERRQLEADFADFKKRMNVAIAIDDRKAAKETLKRAIDRAKEELDVEQNLVKARLDLAKKAVDERLAQEEREKAEKERIRQYDLDQEQKRYDALHSLGEGLMSLNSLIAGQEAENAEFSKAIALFQIGVSSAEAISKGVAASSGVPFPGNLAAIASTVATVLANIAQAQSILSAVPAIDKPEFYEGGEYGYTGDGNPREESKALGTKPYVYHKREYIIDHKTLETPAGAMVARVAESLRKGRGVSSTGIPGFYDGGFAYRTVTQPVIDQTRLEQAFIRAAKSIPAQEVKVSKITAAQKEMQQVRVSLDLRSKGK